MNRLLPLLAIGALCTASACGDDEVPVSITVFQAAPDAIESGQSTMLLFVVDPPDARVAITGLGDQTGKALATVMPTQTTVYRLTATKGRATAEAQTTVKVTPATPRLVLSVPADANAGYAVPVEVAVRDRFGDPIRNYAGTVTFTSSDADAGALTPAPITFLGNEGGVATTSATFMTQGSQTLSASDSGNPVATGSAPITVRGLVYRAPTSGRVRLVANPTASNAQVIQLDLVANERLEMSSFFGGGPGSFAAGMNLPLDTTRVTQDTTLFIPGPALPAGDGTRAAAARIGEDHVLYTAVSRKRTAASVFVQATEVQRGQVFYSVRLKLLQSGSVGPVFDGAQPSPLFRAAVRDQYGDDFVSQNDIGVGTLEVR